MARKGRRPARPTTATPGQAPAPVAPTGASPRGFLPGSLLVHAAIATALVVATWVLYAGDVGLGFFHLDDPTYVVENPWIRDVTLSNLWHILSQPYFANYSPLHILSYVADHAWGGLDPRTYHLSSNLWAALVAVLVYLVSVALAGDLKVAVVAAALFVVHPAHVEAVAWISSRKDLVAAFFALLSVLTYLRRLRVLSFVFFVLAVAGKQSVVVLPAIFVIFDLVLARRRGVRVLVEKLPHAGVAAFFAWRTMGAQPGTGNTTSLFTLGDSLVRNLGLLTGLGQQVIYRSPPDPAAAVGVKVGLGLAALAILALPLLCRRWLDPLTLVLSVWLLLALLPSQVLGFVHPVTDRYLFFPSVPACLLLAHLAVKAGARAGRVGTTVALAGLVAVGTVWTHRTLVYLDEWRDPRSVWFAAAGKSDDANVHLYLAAHYQDLADAIAQGAPPGPPSDAVRRLAEVEWAGDPRLTTLRAEWSRGGRGGPRSREFRAHLLDRALAELDIADRVRGTRILPNVPYRRGKILLERNDLDRARAEFERAYEMSRSHTFADTRNELAVRCHYALGVVAWGKREYATALDLLREAEDEQRRFGGRWVQEVTRERERLEAIVAGGR